MFPIYTSSSHGSSEVLHNSLCVSDGLLEFVSPIYNFYEDEKYAVLQVRRTYIFFLSGMQVNSYYIAHI